MWYAWNPRDDNTSAIYVNNEVELPQFELASVEKTSAINKYNIGNYTNNDGITEYQYCVLWIVIIFLRCGMTKKYAFWSDLLL